MFILIMLQFFSPHISVNINILDVSCSLVTSKNLICSPRNDQYQENYRESHRKLVSLRLDE